jgi:hypothetical protein
MVAMFGIALAEPPHHVRRVRPGRDAVEVEPLKCVRMRASA